MSNWEKFEKECVKYLDSNYGDKVRFELIGGSDSTLSDIKVKEKNFFIEAKMSKSQSGQFVLLIEGNEFIYSSKNKGEINEFSSLILEYINENFSYYKNVGTGAMDIDLPTEYFSSWIENHYRRKNVAFIITKYRNQFVILPISKFSDYFNIKASFRKKTSGSRELPKKYFDRINDFFGDNCVMEGKKVYLVSSKYRDKYQKDFGDIKIQLSLKKCGRYEIRVLGNTKNPNVIFSIECVKGSQAKDLLVFRSSII